MTAPRPASARRAVLGAVIGAALALPLPAAPAKPGIDISGTVDTSLSGGRLSDELGGGFAYSAEQYANLRLRARIGDRGTFHAAANLVAASGAAVAASLAADGQDGYATPFLAGENYAAALELERLYYRIEGETVDLEAGLMRLAFGYGQAWSPSDYLNPRNPLIPDARARGLLAAAATAYPSDEWKLRAFAAGPRDPSGTDGSGAVFGAGADRHGKRASVQVLYALEAAPTPLHRIGASAKIEAGVGIALDALYTAERADDGLDGLQASAGFDYSFFKGKVYTLFQYLYDGGGENNPGTFSGAHYLFGSALWRPSDYTSLALDCALALDDRSLAPGLTLSHEPFQGMTLSLGGRVPLGDGDFGPETARTRLTVTAKAKARF